MFTEYTWQDWQSAPEDKRDMIQKVVKSYKLSDDFIIGLEASAYFRGENTAVAGKTILKADATMVEDPLTGRKTKRLIEKDVVGNRIPASFFFRFVVQENQYLLANGVRLKDEKIKEKLGYGFDVTLEQMGEKALQHGVCWAFWNADHIEAIPAVKDIWSGATALYDEYTGEPMVLIQFWQISANKPLCVRLFEQDGITQYRADEHGKLQIFDEKRAYIQTFSCDGFGEMITGEQNYNQLPILPLYGNSEHRSELTPSIKSKIDLHDNILSDFGDNLDRANDVYWVLNNFGGTETDMLGLIEQINKLKLVSNISDGVGGGSNAEPHTIEVPYAARQTALELLKRALYQDYMALDMNELTGGSLTNVAIRAATAALDSKADRYERECFIFVQKLLRFLGEETENIDFTRQTIVNEAEIIANIYTMRSDIDQQTALKLNPYINQEDIDGIIERSEAQNTSGLSSMEQLREVTEEPEEE